MPVLPEPMPRPTRRPKSVYACVLPLDLRSAPAARPAILYASRTITEKPAEMPLPVSRGFAGKALMQRKNAAPGAAFSMLGLRLLKQSARRRRRHVALALHDDLVECPE